jgi:predicted ribosome quality control (RQC) complex YloA/Tae2 family protein
LPLKIKKGMSSLDIRVAIAELREELVSGILKNIYRVGNKIHLLTIRTKKGSRILLIEPGIRLHLTEFQRQIPEKPDNKILALRKLVRNLPIHEIKQHHSDRLAILELSGRIQATMVIELFGKGNIVVLDDNQRVIYSLWYRKMRDRDLLPGKAFAFPPPLREKSILDVTLEDLLKFATEANSDVQLGKGLALTFAGGGELMNEVIARSQLYPTDFAKDTPQESFELLVTKIADIKSELAIPQPHIIENAHGAPISFQPIHFQSLEGNLKYFSSFNKALDSFFTPMESQNVHALAEEEARLKRLKKTLEKQERRLQELQNEASKYQIVGENIHLVAHQLDELQTAILEARRKGVSWDQIQEKITLGKQKGIESAHLLADIDKKRAFINITIEGIKVPVDLKESPFQAAERFYSLSKKAERKIPTAEASIEDIRLQLANVEAKKGVLLADDEVKVLKRPRKWFEKYHWTHTTNNFLVIAGKDARTNEELVRKRLADEDLYFHASIQGASHTILLLNSADGEPTEEDLIDAATIAGSYSRAWKSGTGAIDVYHVLGDQVSFSAPSGEYVPKGGAIVRGRRTTQSGVLLTIGIGVVFSESWAQIIAGPPGAIQRKCKYHVTLIPGDIRKSKIAKQIRAIFMKKAEEMEIRLIKALDLNEFVSFIPGDSRFAQD